MTSIQPLKPGDWQRWRDIRLASLKTSPDAFGSTLAEALKRSQQSWIEQLEQLPTYLAVLDEQDVGVARGVPNSENLHEAFLISMWVAPEARGKGVGGMLIAAVKDWAKEQGFLRLVLDVADENAAAIALYLSNGFSATGETGSLPEPRQHIREHRMVLSLIA